MTGREGHKEANKKRGKEGNDRWRERKRKKKMIEREREREREREVTECVCEDVQKYVADTEDVRENDSGDPFQSQVLILRSYSLLALRTFSISCFLMIAPKNVSIHSHL